MNPIILLAGVYLISGAAVFVIARTTETAKRDTTAFLLFFSILLWPWLLYMLWEGSPQAQRRKHQKEQKQRADRLTKHRCGVTIEYRPYPFEGSCSGLFRFPSTDFELIVQKYAPRNTELLQWVRNRDETIKTPVEIPGLWNLHWITAAIEQGYSKIFCSACGKEIESFTKETETPRAPSWDAKIFCPKGHLLYRWSLGHISPSFKKQAQ